MIFVLPVCHKEIEQACRLAEWMRVLGGMENETCLIVHTWKAKWDIEQVVARLTPVFRSVSTYLLPLEDETGWPVSSNTMFIQTVEYMHKAYANESWFWWECDVIPLKPGYWEAWVREYNESGKDFMGVINLSRWKTTRDGVVVDGKPRPSGYTFHRGRHMVGAGSYPPEMWTRYPQVQYLPETPFDMAMGEWMVPETHDTKLMCHRWSTQVYELNDAGEIVMGDVEPENNLYGGKPIHPEAVILHGCKDASLINLLASQRKHGSLSSP